MAAKLAGQIARSSARPATARFQMQLHELGTAVQEGLAVTWVVLDEQRVRLGAVDPERTEGPIVATQFAPGTDLA